MNVYMRISLNVTPDALKINYKN